MAAQELGKGWKQRGRQQEGFTLFLLLLKMISSPFHCCPQVMVTNVTSLLKTVKAVEDEATKGTRALEATTEHIRQELAVSTSWGAG